MTLIEHVGVEFCTFLPILESELDPDEFRTYKREIGRIITTMDDCISARVAAEFPDLAPEAVPIAYRS